MDAFPPARPVALALLASISTVCSAFAEPQAASDGWWRDATEASQLSFRHWNGATGEWYFPEINGSGVALFDYDNDGDLDVYLVQGALLGPKTNADALVPPPSAEPMDRLLRNELDNGRVRFTDVTDTVGIRATAYGMAVIAADFDNDGWTDLYLGNYGANQMWRNRGPGADGRITFEDVTDAWRVADRRWTAALAVLDVDRDGRLDLYLGNYLQFEIARHKACSISSGQRDYCHPSSYRGERDLLFRNTLVDGRTGFIDITRRALGEAPLSPTLGVAVIDADDDGRLDIYVANDEQPNQLWRNGGDSTFQDEALLTGCAVNGHGQAEASMGIAAGDVDGDGDTDLFASHLDQQTNTLYINDGGVFRDETRTRGLGAPSLPFTGFGTALLDVDLDSDLDLLVVNGAVQVLDELRRKNDPHPFHQTNQMFENVGRGRFVEAGKKAGPPFQRSEVSRGAAVGDIDNDGDPDVLITQNNGPARLLLNQTRSPGDGDRGPAWIGLRLVAGEPAAGDPAAGEPAAGEPAAGAPALIQLGARVRLKRRAGDLFRRVGVDGSYASSNDPRVLVAPGDGTVTAVEVTWPDGSRESFAAPPLNRYSTLIRNTGSRAADPKPSATHANTDKGNR